MDKLAYLHGAPTVHARFRQQAEHFQVTELLQVQGEEAGEHQWLYIEKRHANTVWVAAQLAKFAGVDERQVSFAGLKDRLAVTRQWFSLQLPGQPLLPWQQLQHPDFKVLQARLAPRKLKSGAHQGNHFRLLLTDISDRDALDARWQQIITAGVPNYFGAQRFGRDGQNLQQARLFLQGQLRKRLSRQQLGLLLSTARSYVFNQLASRRITDGHLQVMPGDALMLQGSHAFFIAEQNDATLQQRLTTGDISLTAPLPGVDKKPLAEDAGAYEAALLADYSEWLAGLQRQRVEASRRALLVRPQQASIHWLDGQQAWLDFVLPRGSFATSVLRELFTLPPAAAISTDIGNPDHDETISE